MPKRQWFESTEHTGWSFDHIFEQPRPGLKLQKLVTVEIVENRVIQTTVRRSFYGADDYQDDSTTEVLMTFGDCADDDN